jgi:hypothetical protein
MKNITVSVPDDVYRQARIEAAERDTSVSALVTAFLWRLAKIHPGQFEELEARQREVMGEIDAFSARDRLDREAIHDRAVR